MENLDAKRPSPEQLEVMEKLGIRHNLVDVFLYRDYRYSKFEDALAEATRNPSK